jgi:dTDP-glucose pyrophosphorylase/CBS domain-containing protein
MSKVEISQFCIRMGSTVRDAITSIDRSARISVALILDDAGKLLGVLTDGDVRRGILAGVGLDAPVTELVAIKMRMPHPRPVTAPVGTPQAALLTIMQRESVRQLPLVDADGRVVDIVILADLMPKAAPALQAVVMAGGFGTRLRPLTDSMPKPMLPVGDRPLLERIIYQIQRAGVRRVSVTTHYQPERIVEHFGDGSAFGVEMSYVHEEKPLGTGGALGLLSAPKEPLLVINGDILTDIDFGAMLSFHQEHQAQMTVAVRRYGVQVPYGVVECEGPMIRSLREKPELSFFVNAGIYLLEPTVFEFIPHGQRQDMTDLIERLLVERRTVVSFPVREYWLDVGQPSDYQRAQLDVASGRLPR